MPTNTNVLMTLKWYLLGPSANPLIELLQQVFSIFALGLRNAD